LKKRLLTGESREHNCLHNNNKFLNQNSVEFSIDSFVFIRNGKGNSRANRHDKTVNVKDDLEAVHA